jgi:competence protein ComEA
VDRSRGAQPRRRLDELTAAARPPVVAPPDVVGGWVPSSNGDDDWTDETAPQPESPPRRVPRAAAVAALVLAAAVGLLVWLRSGGSGQVVDVPAAPARVVGASAPTALPTSLPTTLPTTFPTSLPGQGASPAAPTAGSGALLVVDVEGRVHAPGLVRLPQGSRVADAVRSAGGAARGAVLSRLNLARVLTDGEQLLVPGPGDPVPPQPPVLPSTGSAAGSAPIDLNAATQEGFDALPGVGPVLAARIVAWRTAHGRFTSVDELGEVPGIGPKALERLRPLVSV